MNFMMYVYYFDDDIESMIRKVNIYCNSFYELIFIFFAVRPTRLGELEQKPSISDGTLGARSTIKQERPLKQGSRWRTPGLSSKRSH